MTKRTNTHWLWQVSAFAAAFEGCGGLKADEINKITFSSKAASKDQQFCLADIKLQG